MSILLRVLFLLPVLLTSSQGPSGYYAPLNATLVAGLFPPPPPPTTTTTTTTTYTSSIVEAEFIVVFVSYYTTEARDGFISAALRPFSNWAILPRANPSADYPSDFSLVQVSGSEGHALRALNQHPIIKRVTPQKKLTRILTSGGGKGINYTH